MQTLEVLGIELQRPISLRVCLVQFATKTKFVYHRNAVPKRLYST